MVMLPPLLLMLPLGIALKHEGYSATRCTSLYPPKMTTPSYGTHEAALLLRWACIRVGKLARAPTARWSLAILSHQLHYGFNHDATDKKLQIIIT